MVRESHNAEAVAQQANRAVELEALDKAVRDQEGKVGERRKVLATIVRTKGITYKGSGSFYGKSGVDEDQGAKSALQTYHQLEQEKMQLESQISSLQKYDSDQLMTYAGGLDLPDNIVRELYPKYQETGRQVDALKSEGYGDTHPVLKNKQEQADALERSLDEGVVGLRDTMKARLDLANDRLKSVEFMKDETREEAIKRGLDAQDYVDAKRDFQSDQEVLQGMKLKQAELNADVGTTPVTEPALMAKNLEAPRPARPRVTPAPSTSDSAGSGDVAGGLMLPFEEKPAAPNSGDRYGTFIDQPWKNPSSEPLSTFSIDVDTASYGNVRRMIREGRDVPRDAVRIEECINAFSYNYATPNGGAGIKRAYEMAMKEKIAGGVNRVILATDGDFNVGVTGKDSLVELVKERASNGVYLTVLGYANRVLRNEDFNNDKIDAGDIGAGHTVTAFYELTPPGTATAGLKYRNNLEKPTASDEWMTVKLRHKDPDGDESTKIEFPLTGNAVPLDRADVDFQFATAVALFGMKLRGMEEVREIGWEKVMELATPGLADDASEDRAEFVGLVKKLAGSRQRIVPAPAEIIPTGGKR